jgi:hypothetical protein
MENNEELTYGQQRLRDSPLTAVLKFYRDKHIKDDLPSGTYITENFKYETKCREAAKEREVQST